MSGRRVCATRAPFRLGTASYPAIVRASSSTRASSTSANRALPNRDRAASEKRKPLPPLDYFGSELKPGAALLKGPRGKGVFEASVRQNMDRYPDALLLTQVGTFYESYFDQAAVVARTLSIKLTSKTFEKVAQPFTGFPLTNLAKHVSTLIEAGNKVVTVEEFRGEMGGIERRVTRVITPGTGLDEGFVRSDRMNFVLAVKSGVNAAGSQVLGLAYRDVATGASFTKLSDLNRLLDDLILIDPREIIIEETLKGEAGASGHVWGRIKLEAERHSWMLSFVPSAPVSSVDPEASAESLLLSYISNSLPSSPTPLLPPQSLDRSRFLQMDASTLQALEIKTSMRGGLRGSLLQAVKRTVTPAGARLLGERLCAPSTIVAEIQVRLTLVDFFRRRSWVREDIRLLLKTLEDTPRLLQKIFMRRGTAFDILGVRKAILVGEGIRSRIEEELLGKVDSSNSGEELGVVRSFLGLGQAGCTGGAARREPRHRDELDLGMLIGETIDEEALVKRTADAETRASIAEVLGETAADRAADLASNGQVGLWGKDEHWVIKPSSPELAALHSHLQELRISASTLESSLQNLYQSPHLSLRVIQKLGAAIHVQTRSKGAALISVDRNASLVAKSGSTQAFTLPAWVTLYSKIVSASTAIRDHETEALRVLTSRLLEHYLTLQSAADAMAELDVTIGFADLAEEMNYVRPVVDDGTSLNIVAGRHPTVELALLGANRSFVANSVHLYTPTSFLHLITGANAAGKSTFLRQTALITILAQAGSFVPADAAQVGVVDRVFTRIGARDELDRDRSTFMVEMDEASEILRLATPKSLVLFDEVGRGTSPVDGVAISYATLEHLLNVNRSRTLFATHFHDLAKLIGYRSNAEDEQSHRGVGEWEGIEFWCTDATEDAEGIVSYSYGLRRGLNGDSHGIAVARASGMPKRAVGVAAALKRRLDRSA